MDEKIRKPSFLCYGEVLYDVFDVEKQPGGAPLNVALHLSKLGMYTAIISKVGADSHGRDLLEYIQTNGVDISLIQSSIEHPTGVVQVSMGANEHPEYEIVEGVAWDYIDHSFLYDIGAFDFIIHGSLACRSVMSRTTLEQLKNRSSAKVVFDLNLRAPYYDKKLILSLLASCHYIKLNEEELIIVQDWLGIQPESEGKSLEILVDQFSNLELVIVTRGGEGAMAWYEGGLFSVEGIKVEVVNTVGSGDAFLGAFLSQFSINQNVTQSLRFAAAVGGFVATHVGANPTYTERDILELMNH